VDGVDDADPAEGVILLRPLRAEELYRPADLSKLEFLTTADLQPAGGLAGQARASDAIQFGTEVEKAGFNLFVIGPHGARMQEAVKAVLADEACKRPAPSDWVYVNNFAEADRPAAIELPAGHARKFQDAMRKLIDDLKSALPAVFQSEEYQTRRGAIDEAFQKKQGEAFSALRDKAAQKDILILRTPLGFALAPAHNGHVVPPDDFNAWPEAKRREVQAVIETLEKDLEHILHQIPQWEKQRRDEVRRLNRDTAKFAADQLINEAKAAFGGIERIVQHIDAVRTDIIENFALFAGKGEEGEGEPPDLHAGSPFDRYEVNVLVSQDGHTPGAPVVEELHPTLGNLIGRIEYVSLRGVLVTNFRLIKAGAIHRANGGYLLLDVRSLLMEPFSWTALKRTLRRGEIAIEDVARFLGLTSTVSLEPDPIPLKVKVVLFGDRLLYFLLAAFDPELAEHFKVLADFEDDIARTADNEAILARVIAAIAQRDGLRPLDRDSVALVIEHTARLAQHAGKLSLVVEQPREILIEADYCARQAKRDVICRDDVERALSSRIQRSARLRDRAQEAVIEKVALIETEGAHTGQINGLSVIELGGFAFGRPSRITCQVRPGSGRVVDIEREVELGGPVHSKGVLILSGYLAGRYALDTPMSLFASLVFEQSYAGVEGDSASSAELYALLSALAEVPLRQDLAVTGSVNQHGEIQAIGGVNEKIEGFFDICRARGLNGTQGVLIPQANVQHLMLRKDVIEACAANRFAVYPVATINEGISLLTGVAAGERGADGAYPPGSLNRRVEDRLRSFASIRKSFGTPPGGSGLGGN
jgi:predicted ATP-dependent protease